MSNQKRQDKVSGSVTIFSILILLVIASLFFSMAEAVRILEMQAQSRMQTVQAAESLGSEYQLRLWQQYRILALDMSYGQGQPEIAKVQQRLGEFAWDNAVIDRVGLVDRSNFFRLQPEDCQILSYGLLTDHEGLPFIKQGVSAAKAAMPADLAQQWIQIAKQSESASDASLSVEDLVEAGKDAIDSVEQQKDPASGTESVDNTAESGDTAVVDADNPFTIFSQIKEKGLLGLVTEKEISQKTMETAQAVSARRLSQGTLSSKETLSLTDRMYFIWYLENYFGCFTEGKENRGLTYEIEYIVAGKDNDRDNLESLVNRLIGMREAENMITIVTSEAMMQQAYTMAVTLAAISGNPVVIQAVQMAVVAIWALIESILDVRTLLGGGKVPFLKTQAQWTSDVMHLGSALTKTVQAKEAASGLSYKNYLMVFLYLQKDKELGLRPLDLIEATLEQEEGTADCKMDGMIYALNISISYEGSPLFFSYMGSGTPKLDLYHYTQCYELDYGMQ